MQFQHVDIFSKECWEKAELLVNEDIRTGLNSLIFLWRPLGGTTMIVFSMVLLLALSLL
jgi:hypothetical protein